MIIKKLKIGLILLLILSLSTTALAQNQAELEPDQKINRLRNVGQFFLTLIDFDNNFRFFGDDVFAPNQCVRRDLLAIHAAKDQISDYILANLGTLTESQLEIQKEMYRSYSAELFFLRNINTLRNEDGSEFELSQANLNRLKGIVESKVRSDFVANIDILFPIWIGNYSTKLDDYLDCRNSWTVVTERVESIENQAQQIAEAAKALKDQAKDLGQEIASTPRNTFINTRNNIEYSAINSFMETRDSFNSGIREMREELEVFSANRREVAQELERINAQTFGLRRGVAETVLSNQNLTSISQSLPTSLSASQANYDLLQQVTQASLVNSFTDSSNLVLLEQMIGLNANLKVMNEQITNDDTGISQLLVQVEDLQCRE